MKKWFLLVVVFLLLPMAGEAQCAMCRAVTESSHQGGSSVGDGLNLGIVYLMAFPYLLLGGVGYAIYHYRKSRS